MVKNVLARNTGYNHSGKRKLIPFDTITPACALNSLERIVKYHPEA